MSSLSCHSLSSVCLWFLRKPCYWVCLCYTSSPSPFILPASRLCVVLGHVSLPRLCQLSPSLHRHRVGVGYPATVAADWPVCIAAIMLWHGFSLLSRWLNNAVEHLTYNLAGSPEDIGICWWSITFSARVGTVGDAAVENFPVRFHGQHTAV